VSNEVLNTAHCEAAFVLVEHLILGPRLAGTGARLEAAGGRLVPLTDDGVALIDPGLARP
jgi:hypothetical protein